MIPATPRKALPESRALNQNPLKHSRPSQGKLPTPKKSGKAKPPGTTSQTQPSANDSTHNAGDRLPPGFRQIAGKHLLLITDLGPSAEIDALPHVFDMAVPEWCRVLGYDPQKAADWHITGYLMKLRERFEQAGPGLAKPAALQERLLIGQRAVALRSDERISNT